jgi:hypothetical protein
MGAAKPGLGWMKPAMGETIPEGSVPVLATRRLRLDAFTELDVSALAAILAEPDVSRDITADASTAERCIATPTDRIGSDPEILYGLAPACWGHGLGTEAAAVALDWLFGERAEAGVSAVIFGGLNPASAAVLEKLGMRRRGKMAMADFLPDLILARRVVEYEIWRLEYGACSDPDAPGSFQGRTDRHRARRSRRSLAGACRGSHSALRFQGPRARGFSCRHRRAIARRIS